VVLLERSEIGDQIASIIIIQRPPDAVLQRGELGLGDLRLVLSTLFRDTRRRYLSPGSPP